MADILHRSKRHTREDSGIRLDRNLVWWHDEEKVEHPGVIEAFNVGLVPVEDGKFQLRIGKDYCFVAVEDAAYRVNALDVTEDRVYLRLSDRQGEPLDPATLAMEPDGVMSCRVKAGRAKARFGREAQFTLGELLTLDGDHVALGLPGRTLPTSLRSESLGV